MPVIQLSLNRLKAYARNKVSEEKILDSLPYLGLDVEEKDGDSINVEYSPNRPDFSSEAGIARSLLGLLEIEMGIPRYNFTGSQITVLVEGDQIRLVRPYIYCLHAAMAVTDEAIVQIISAQEDLHNGLGAKRSKLAIGIHNADVIRPPIKYYATSDINFSFVPLGTTETKTIEEILEKSEQGLAYGRLVESGSYPLLVDNSGNVLSLPPIINGELTRLKAGVKSLFVDVTATDRRAGDEAIAIVASMISDMGGEVQTVKIENTPDGTIVTPDMAPSSHRFDLKLVNRILGLSLNFDEARHSLQKSRLELSSDEIARVPRFRSDIIHPIDMAEEVLLGYGVPDLKPQKVRSSLIGSLSSRSQRLTRLAEVMVGLGLVEIEDFALTSRNEIESIGSCGSKLQVENPKSQSYEFLRGDALTSLLKVLADSRHEEYPQRLFEQPTAFIKSDSIETGAAEEQHIAVVLADAKSSFSSASSVLGGFLRLALPRGWKSNLSTINVVQKPFVQGRCASISISTKSEAPIVVGTVGEISPEILDLLGLEVPVSAFEMSIEQFLKD